jgi:hypothetical protein
MITLTYIYNQISAQDAQLLEKQAEVLKIAEEHDAAGRIMARGFADELHKIAQGETPQWPRQAAGVGSQGGTIKTGPYQTGGGRTAPTTISRRPAFSPPKPVTNIAGRNRSPSASPAAS